MKRKLRTTIYLFAVLFFVGNTTTLLAHQSYQAGILATTYHTILNRYCVGGEHVGWSIDEEYHTNGTTVTYRFLDTDPELTDVYRNMTISGAAKWSGTVTITNTSDGTGVIRTVDDPYSDANASFTEYYQTDSMGHLSAWAIEINRSGSPTVETLAHEFGHAIGLNDLVEAHNNNKLMYGYETRTVSNPTSIDKWGAKVITGVHTTHTWGGYKYHSTNSVGNVHIKYCVSCNGNSTITEQCSYNSNNICIKCNVPYGASANSVEYNQELQQ